MTTTTTIPIIDISSFVDGVGAAGRELAGRVAQACTETGVLVISGHGVPDHVVSDLYDAARAFFELPLEEKMAVARPQPGPIRGYSGVESEGLALLEGEPPPPDLKELFDAGPLDVPSDDPYFTDPAAGEHFAP